MPEKFDIDQIIQIFGLQPLSGEGGLFRQSWVSPQRSVLNGSAAVKPCGTAIFYLLTGQPDSFSALHRLPTDEIWHFYLGDPLEMTLLYPDRAMQQVYLGQDILAGQQVQFVAPAGVWQGTRIVPGGRFALMGTTMAPGFVPSDFELGSRESLLRQYPQASQQIIALTRNA